jgi:prolyl 4-hydroxylase
MQNAWYSGDAMQPPEAAVRFPTLIAASDGDALQLPDRIAHIRLWRQTPELVVIDDFLSASECAALIAAARPRLAASETVADDSDALARTSQGMFFDPGETALIRQIDARVAHAFQWPITHAEDLQVTRYQVDQRYEPHRDYFSHTTPEAISGVQRFGQRVATVLFYLNEPERGGETRFLDLDLTVKPRQGTAVFFSYPSPNPESQTLHEGCPVLSGEKWIANKWLRAKAFG